MQQRYPLNKGDFYVINERCTACGAPQAEAPDIIEHEAGGHCYFKKQPETEAETDQAILAMMVACMDSLRYGGTDEKILRRLYENGMAGLCDHKPSKGYLPVDRACVSFVYEGSIPQLVNSLMVYLLRATLSSTVSTYEISPEEVRLDHRWQILHLRPRYYSYTIRRNGDKEMSITMGVDPNRGNNVGIYEFLQQDERVSEIKWWAQSPGGGEWYNKPF